MRAGRFPDNRKQAAGAGLYQWREIIYVAMHYQSLTAVNQAGLLIGRDKVTRLDRLEGTEPIDLDDWEKARRLLPEEAFAVAEQYADRISEISSLRLRRPTRRWHNFKEHRNWPRITRHSPTFSGMR